MGKWWMGFWPSMLHTSSRQNINFIKSFCITYAVNHFDVIIMIKNRKRNCALFKSFKNASYKSQIVTMQTNDQYTSWLQRNIQNQSTKTFQRNCLLQVNLFQRHLFLHQLTHNMTKDCSLIYQFSTWKLQAQNMLCT